MAGANVKTFTNANWKTEVMEAGQPVLVDFWAAWCGPCRMIAPVIEQLADEYAGKVVVGKLNVDENRETAIEYGVMSIPTLLLFKDGKPVERIVGYQTKEQLSRILAKHI